MSPPDLAPVLAHWTSIDAPTLSLRPISDGLINDTFALGDDHILQRLHPIFAAEVNLDIDALTRTLRLRGVPVPTLTPSDGGPPWTTLRSPEALAGVWRVMTRIDGETHHTIQSGAQARSAGAMLGRFHTALLGSDHRFAFTRAGVHDTPKHLRALETALETHAGHRLWSKVGPLAAEIARRLSDLTQAPDLPARIIHGDPKISNLLFDGDEAVGVVDLDTMARSTVDLDVGDAMRSWCNTGRESGQTPHFDADIFEAACAGYIEASRPWLTEPERRIIPSTTERICLELSARFAADALNESYFGWDPSAAPTRGEHNLLRARGQLLLSKSVSEQRSGLSRRLEGL